ncbi:MAG: LTA synthase family protein [Lachnospiraceae bacterium]|nr:LTA synthase family protein [Lachnospiraceae bacterium]MDD3617331.1 LTA synthase family protein [Lachnospiraceae bacterium]
MNFPNKVVICKKIKQYMNNSYTSYVLKFILIASIMIFIAFNYASFNEYNDKEFVFTETLIEGKQDTISQYTGSVQTDSQMLDEVSFVSEHPLSSDELKVKIRNTQGELAVKDYTFQCRKLENGYQIRLKFAKDVNTTAFMHMELEITGKAAPDLEQWNVVCRTFPTAELFLMLLMIVLLFGKWILKTGKNEDTVKKMNGHIFVYAVLGGAISFLTIESLYNLELLSSMPTYIILGNWFCFFLIYLMITVLFNSLRWGMITTNILFLILGIANHYILLFRGQPIQPVDWNSFGTAAEVVHQYDYSMTKEILQSILLSIIFVAWMIVIEERKFSVGWKKNLIIHAVGVVSLIGGISFLTSDYYINTFHMTIYQWRPMETYKQYGFALSFIAFEKEMKVEKPEGYSVDNIEEQERIIESGKEEEKVSEEKPDIIVVMNESFADLGYIRPFETTSPYMEYFNSIQDNVIKGHMLVSVIGGGTADTEYEFLTGHSIELFQNASIPYATTINESHYSLATTLKAQGYQAIAMHPNKAENWRRNIVYPYLGFDRFIDIDEFTDPIYFRYISDRSVYDKILEEQDNNSGETPMFLFAVTMQNHGGYATQEDVTSAAVDVNYDDVNQYLTAIRASDQALKRFIEELKTREKPTIVVFFGDHYPNLNAGFMNWLYQKNDSELTLEELERKYSVPYFIWANYDLGIGSQQDQITSAN